MGLFGVGVLVTAGWHAITGIVPHPELMGVIGVTALVANGVVAATLYAYRSGDSNMRSIWLCSRNDVIGNLAVLLAAIGVFGTGSGWPDVLIAVVMAGLSIFGARQIIRQAWSELSVPGRQPTHSTAAVETAGEHPADPADDGSAAAMLHNPRGNQMISVPVPAQIQPPGRQRSLTRR